MTGYSHGRYFNRLDRGIASESRPAYDFQVDEWWESRMSEVEQIESRIRNLSPEDLVRFRAWFAEFDALAWDGQIEADAASGKLDHLIDEALAEHGAGKSRPI